MPRKAENEIRVINRELHELSAHFQNVREAERTRMDVHSPAKQAEPGNAAIDQKFADIYALIAKAVKSIREIAARLRRGIIDDLGLVAASRWHSQAIRESPDLRIDFVCEPAEANAPDGESSPFPQFQVKHHQDT